MSSLHNPPFTSATGSSESLRLLMERSVDELSELARQGLEPALFFGEVLRRSLHPGGATSATLWRKSLEGGWESAGELPLQKDPSHQRLDSLQDLLEEVSGGAQPRVVVDSVENGNAKNLSVLSPLRHANTTVGILETSYPALANASLPATVFQYVAALGEITADFLSQQELEQLRRVKAVWQQWDHFQQRLQQSLDLPSICATIANDGRVLVDCDRVTVLTPKGSRYRVQAMSGVESVDPRAGAVQSLERFANGVDLSGGQIWSVLPPTQEIVEPVRSALDRYHRESNACGVGVISATGAPDASISDRPIALIVLESFSAAPKWRESQALAETLVQRSTFALRAALTLHEIPGLVAWESWRRRRHLLRRPKVVLAMLFLTLVTMGLIFIPAEFTVSGHGELWPRLRRDVFASTAGIVDQILVKHGDDVRVGQPLLILRDPELEQDTPRVVGELATTRERLRGVQLARLTSGATSENAGKLRQLAADEEELKERLKTLERQRVLIEDRERQLTLRSPIDGKVLSWDLAQHLSARPVERGQSLMTVGETDGAWIVEVQVADEDTGHLLRAQQKLGDRLQVDFQLPSEPGRTYRGTIREISLTSESNDQSTGHTRAVVEFERNQVAQLRPGATAIPRIHCGRTSLGYVWLHDLIDAIRIWLMF